MTGRRVPFSHPFFDMDPEEFWSRRYAGMPPEFWSSGFSRPAGPGAGPPAGGSFPSSGSGQMTQRNYSRRELVSGSGSAPPSQIWEQHFGGDPFPTGAKGDQSKDAAGSISPQTFYIRRPDFQRQTSGSSEIVSDEKSFKVSLDVQQFTPDELDVRVVDGEVLIHAKHEQREDEHGYVTREFTRRYKLPEDVDPESVKSALSEEGMLSVEAPRKLAKELEGQKIPIEVHAKSPAVEGASASSEDQK